MAKPVHIGIPVRSVPLRSFASPLRPSLGGDPCLFMPALIGEKASSALGVNRRDTKLHCLRGSYRPPTPEAAAK